jgi:hypothetical protein
MVPKMLEHRRARERATEEGASRESGRAMKVSKTTANGEAMGIGEGVGGRVVVEGEENGVSQ